MPQGTAGLQPNLSIVYNSQSSGGILGQGWDISGFSAITRVPANTYFDNQIDPVDFDTLDRFGINNHVREWYETQANRMSYRYFSNHDPTALSASSWTIHIVLEGIILKGTG